MYIDKNLVPPRTSHARLSSDHILKTAGMKFMNDDTISAKTVSFLHGKKRLMKISIFSIPSLSSSEVELLKRIDALWTHAVNFTRSTAVSLSSNAFFITMTICFNENDSFPKMTMERADSVMMLMA